MSAHPEYSPDGDPAALLRPGSLTAIRQPYRDPVALLRPGSLTATRQPDGDPAALSRIGSLTAVRQPDGFCSRFRPVLESTSRKTI